MIRSHRATEVTPDHIGEEVVLAGWVQRRRDHGGITFLDLRDASGLIQVVADPEQHPVAEELRMEYCVRVTGVVRPRPEGTENPNLATGTIEVAADGIEVLSTAKVLPFMIDDRAEVEELVRLRYRYLDLRRPKMAANLRARSRATAAIRRTLDDLGFLEVETPDPGQLDPGRRPGHAGAESSPQGGVLRAPAVTAALQAAPDGRRG